jgi:hypothetical protein
VNDRVLPEQTSRGVDASVRFRVLAPKEKFRACQGESVRWYWVAGDGLW